MRYVLFPEEERRFLETLRHEFRLVPLTPEEPADFASDMSTPEPKESRDLQRPWRYEYCFWAPEFGPIVRLGDRSEDMSVKARVGLKMNQEANADWKSAIDMERTPVITWTRPRWYDALHRWIVPGRLGAMRMQIKTYPQEYLTFVRSIERILKKGGVTMNSWDIQGDGPFTLDGKTVERPGNTGSYNVTVWPEAENWVRNGGKVYHWDG